MSAEVVTVIYLFAFPEVDNQLGLLNFRSMKFYNPLTPSHTQEKCPELIPGVSGVFSDRLSHNQQACARVYSLLQIANWRLN